MVVSLATDIVVSTHVLVAAFLVVSTHVFVAALLDLFGTLFVSLFAVVKQGGVVGACFIFSFWACLLLK